jgi:HEPN domain-containing protein
MNNNNKYVQEWFRLADNDLFIAESTFSNHPEMHEIICYHCQQSAEKYLKGFLLFNATKPPKIHEIDKLCEMCAEFDIRFDEIAKICAPMTAYSNQPRYPFEIELDEYQAKQAIDYAQQIKNFDPLFEVRKELEKPE